MTTGLKRGLTDDIHDGRPAAYKQHGPTSTKVVKGRQAISQDAKQETGPIIYSVVARRPNGRVTLHCLTPLPTWRGPIRRPRLLHGRISLLAYAGTHSVATTIGILTAAITFIKRGTSTTTTILLNLARETVAHFLIGYLN